MPSVVEDAMQHRGALVDSAGGEQLLGRGPLEIDTLGRRRALRLVEIHLRGLGAPPGPLEQLGQAQPKAMDLRRRAGKRLQSESVERHGAIERELRGGLLRGPLGVLSGALALAGSDEVRGDRLRIPVRRRLEHAGQRPVVLADDPRRELRHDHLADPIVDHLDGLDPVADPGPHEAPRSHETDRVVDRVADACGVRRDGDGQRAPCHRHDAKQPELSLRESLEARLHHLLEGDGRDSGRRVLGARDAVRSADAARELVDQEGATPRPPGRSRPR